MLAPNVRFEGYTTEDWTRLLSLFQPRKANLEQRDADRPQGGIILVHENNIVRKLLHTDVGRLRTTDTQLHFPMSAEQVAQMHHASWAILFRVGTLESVMEQFGTLAKRHDTLTSQILRLIHLIQSEVIKGNIDYWPSRLAGVPIPSAPTVERTLDAICPINKSIVIGVFDEGDLWTSVTLRRSLYGIDWIVGPEDLRNDLGILSGDFRRDYRHIGSAVESKVGEIAFGCYAEAHTLRKLTVDDSPGAWAKAATIRDVILSPLPPALAIPLGFDAGRAALVAAKAIVEHVDPLGIIMPLLKNVAESIPVSEAIPKTLGINVLEVIRKLLTREQ